MCASYLYNALKTPTPILKVKMYPFSESFSKLTSVKAIDG